MKGQHPSRPICAILVALIATVVLGPIAAHAEEAAMAAVVRDNVQKTDCRMWVKRFDRFRLEWPLEPGESSIRCVTRVEDDGRPRKGAKVELSVGVIDERGTLASLGTRSAKTGPDGSAVFEFPISSVQQGRGLEARVDGRYRSWKKATTVRTDCDRASP